MRVVKNKIVRPFKVVEIDLMHEYGISREGDLLDLGIEDKLIEKSGALLDQLRGNSVGPRPRKNAKQ